MSNTRRAKRKIIYLIIAIIFMLTNILFISVNKCFGVFYQPDVMYALEDVDVKNEANQDSTNLGILMENEEVSVISIKFDWVEIKTQNLTGFVKRTYLTDAEPEFTITPESKTLYCTKSAKLREKPNKESTSKATIMSKEIVKMVAKVNNENWYRVTYGNKSGYVHSTYFSNSKPDFTITAMNKTLYCTKETSIRTGPSTNYKKTGTVVPREVVKVTAKVNGKNYYRVNRNGKIVYVYGKYLSSKKPSYTIKQMKKTMYCLKTTYLRSTPSKDYKKKDTITANEKVKVIAKVNGKNLYKVKYNNKTGFAYSKNLTTKKPKFIITKLNKTKYTSCALNLRKGPSTSYKKITTIPANTKVKVTGKVNGKNWYRIRYNGNVGYIDKNYLMNNKINGTVIGSYKDKTANITVYKEWYQDAYVYAAHIKFTNYNRFKSTTARGGYETTSSVASRTGAVLAVNGPYMGSEYAVVRNGSVINNRKIIDDLAIYNSKTGKLANAGELGLTGKYASKAVKNGQVTDTFKFFNSTLVKDGANVANPDNWDRAQRTFMGTNGKAGDIWICVSDGRYNDGSSVGLRKYQCAKYLRKIGCNYGVMLDGGGSSTMVFKGKTLNAAKYGQRAVIDFVYFR